MPRLVAGAQPAEGKAGHVRALRTHLGPAERNIRLRPGPLRGCLRALWLHSAIRACALAGSEGGACSLRPPLLIRSHSHWEECAGAVLKEVVPRRFASSAGFLLPPADRLMNS